MSEDTARPARPATRSALLGAMFLMATSAIGPGFITQTTTFTAELGATFAVAILISILVDIAVQLNIWRVIGVANTRAQDLANKVVPGAGYLLAALIVFGGLIFNVGNLAGTGLGLNAMVGFDTRLGAVLSAVLAVVIGCVIGTVLGLVAAARGGWTEEVIMRVCDLGFAFPALLFAIMLAAAFGPSLTMVVIAISFINIPTFARVSRAAANQVWRREYVWAARAAGMNSFAISRDHILPNIAAPVIVQATIEFAVAILTEAALSYLGLGAQPPAPSWGRMLSEAQTLMYLAPQLAIWPGLCIFAAVLGFGLLGDGLRDITDPRLAKARTA